MKSRKRIWMLCIILVFVLFQSIGLQAAETAVFTVHTAKVNSDGTITVGISVSGNERIGGFDLSIKYDSNVVEYVSGGFEGEFSDGIGEIYNHTDLNVIKCVAVYNDGVNGNGELLYVNFRLMSQESYQPSVEVNDLLDSSAQMNDIPYQILYQQSDGSEAAEPDLSGKAADNSIQEHLPQYSDNNISEMIPEELQDDSQDSEISTDNSENEMDGNETNLNSNEKDESEYDTDSLKEDQSNKQERNSDEESDTKMEKEGTKGKIIIGILIVMIIVVLGIVWTVKKKVNKTGRKK